MFKELRRKFILITLALVGIVLAATLAALVAATWSSARQQIDRSLELALADGSGAGSPGVGLGSPEDLDDDGRDYLRTPILVVTVEDGEVSFDSMGSFFRISSDSLDEVVEAAETSGSDTGTVAGQHIAWRRSSAGGGSYRLAMADTSSIDSTIVVQAFGSLGILAAALLAMFLIARSLAGWALRPVEESWERQRRFVADASHELKTPVSVILANSQILASEGLDAESRKWVDSTAEEAKRMKSLVNDLLELARTDNDLEAADARAEAARHSEVDLSGLVDKVTLQFDAVAFERECLIESDIAPHVLVRGLPSQLERLVTILVDNACKYAPAGTTVRVRLSREGGRARLDVTNGGDPIAPEDLPHVFERFWRSDTVRTKSEASGYGLGLSIAKGIVDVHRGRISASSTEADGTTFTVIL